MAARLGYDNQTLQAALAACNERVILPQREWRTERWERSKRRGSSETKEETYGFPIWQIALTAVVACAGSILALLLVRRTGDTIAAGDLFALGIVVGLAVFIWRVAGNVPPLNDDPAPGLVSPNDLLSPVVTYVALGLYAAVRPPIQDERWNRLRAGLTLVCFVANVVVI